MDRFERHAHEYLLFCGYKDVVYEPNGNIPPDFRVANDIAVEVRLLNENVPNQTTPIGLEQARIPFFKKFASLIASYGPPSPRRWWVLVHFQRPPPKWKTIEKQMADFLQEVIDGALSSVSRTFGDRIEIKVARRASDADVTFSLPVQVDEDSGGMLSDLLEYNVALCITQKTAKIAPYRNSYKKWWLILVDDMARAMLDEEWLSFQENTNIAYTWDRVILLDAFDHKRCREL